MPFFKTCKLLLDKTYYIIINQLITPCKILRKQLINGVPFTDISYIIPFIHSFQDNYRHYHKYSYRSAPTN